ncbi:MAG TPA: thiamine pyrophosphate-binding protein [Acidimicrobiales bacterium]|nr:thiamine pyrophosphate-binding protein [Acidimicrobiales bacterium]
MQVAEALGGGLAALGVRHLFGVVGSGNFAVAQAAATAGVAFVAARQETAAVAMADGYARVSGEIGVVTLHQGPGLTNAATGVAEAAKARTPVVVLAADTAAGDRRSNFRIDAPGLASSVGAVVERLATPESATGDLARALRRARVERRAVVLLAPVDVLGAACAGALPEEAAPGFASDLAPRPAPRAVCQLADLVGEAARPVVLAGRGGVLSAARGPLERLASAMGAPVATSAVANGLFAGSPRALGISGGFASPAAARTLARADLVLAFGASLNAWTTRHGALVAPGARVAQVDVDADALGVHLPIDLGVVGDAAETATVLAEELARRGHRGGGDGATPSPTGWAAAARPWREEAYQEASTADRVDPRTLSIGLDRLLPPDRTVAVDSGHFMGWPAMYLGVPDPAAFVFTQAFQSVGLGLASGIGAAVARPERLTVACVGDGGALMALGELETVARLGGAMVVVIYNDAAYGAEVHHFGPLGYPVDLARFPDTDFAAQARALGAEGVTVRQPGDLDALQSWLARRERPLVIDAKVNPAVVAEWLEEAFRVH